MKIYKQREVEISLNLLYNRCGKENEK